MDCIDTWQKNPRDPTREPILQTWQVNAPITCICLSEEFLYPSSESIISIYYTWEPSFNIKSMRGFNIQSMRGL